MVQAANLIWARGTSREGWLEPRLIILTSLARLRGLPDYYNLEVQ